MVEISTRSSRQFMERAVCKGVNQKRGAELPRKLMEGPRGRWGVGSEDEVRCP